MKTVNNIKAVFLILFLGMGFNSVLGLISFKPMKNQPPDKDDVEYLREMQVENPCCFALLTCAGLTEEQANEVIKNNGLPNENGSCTVTRNILPDEPDLANHQYFGGYRHIWVLRIAELLRNKSSGCAQFYRHLHTQEQIRKKESLEAKKRIKELEKRKAKEKKEKLDNALKGIL